MAEGTEREIAALKRELERQREELSVLRSEVERSRPTVVVSDRSVSRRRVLGMVGAAAAGVATAAVAASPAGAANNDPILIGDDTLTGTEETRLTGSAAATLPTFHAVTTTANGIGIKGTATTNPGTGVYAQATISGGLGLDADAPGGIAVVMRAPGGQGGAHARLDPHGSVAGPPTSTGFQHENGELWMDSSSVLWQCVATGNPGTWVKQAPLVLLASPVRVYDSRAGQPNQAPNVQGTISFTAAPPSANSRVIRCNKDASTGSTAVPPSARALLMNLSAISVSGVGALSVYANGASQPSTSSLNWTAGGQIVANSVTSACDANQDIRVAIPAGAGASCNFVVDVTGYYL